METDPSQPEPDVARPVESSKESHNITANSPSESDSNSNPTTLMTKPTETENMEVVENVAQPMSPVATKTLNMEPKEEVPAVPSVHQPTTPTTPTPPTTYAQPAPPPPPIHSSVPTPTNIPQPTTTAVITTSQSQPPLAPQSGYSEPIAPVPNATPPHHPIPQTTHHNMPPHIVPHQGRIFNLPYLKLISLAFRNCRSSGFTLWRFSWCWTTTISISILCTAICKSSFSTIPSISTVSISSIWTTTAS